MSDAATQLSFTRLPPDPAMQRVRLLPRAGGAAAAVARPAGGGPPHGQAPLAIDRVAPDHPGQNARLFTVPQLLAGSPEWDITLDAAGAPLLAITDFGGAINAVCVRGAAGTAPLPPPRDTDDLRDPRFVRGARAGGALTALANEREVLLYEPKSNGGYGAPRVLARAQSIDSALLLARVSGWLLLTRRPELGVQRGRFPGVLMAQPLAADFAPAGAAFAVFGEQRIFDFDADVTARGFTALAITAGGFALARFTGGGMPTIEQQPNAVLSGPVSLLPGPNSLSMAFFGPGESVTLASAPP